MTDQKIYTRRNLIKASSLAFAPLFVPTAFAETTPAIASAESFKWSSMALHLGQHAAGAIVRHPFIAEVCTGTLAKSAFIAYMALNIEYLDAYAKSLDYLAARVGITDALNNSADLLRTWSKETLGVKNWCKELYQKISQKEYNAKRVKSYAAGVDYAQFERMYAVKYDVAVGMAALLPCFWIYDQIGSAIAKSRQMQNNPYTQWLESFGTEASHESCLSAIALADNFAQQADDVVRQQMTDVFVAGCWKEFACFDAAYRSLFRRL